MYENEYGNINTSSTPTGKSQGTGTYTDYVGYGPTGGTTGNGGTGNYGNTASGGSSNGSGNKKKKNSGKGKMIAGFVAILLVGLLAGGGISYALMVSRDAKTQNTQSEQATLDDGSKNNYLEGASSGNGNGTTKDGNNSTTAENSSDSSLTQAEDSFQQTNLPQTASDGTMTVAQIAETCLPSVVAITNTGVTEVRSMWGNFTQESQSAGSGVIIGENDNELLILTNYHVIENNESLSVVFSWEEGDTETADKADITKAVVKDYDASRDIAVISVNMSDLSSETKSKIVVATIGNSNDLKLGEQIVAIGNALGYGQSVTTGIVSALDRTVKASSSSGSSTIGSANVYIQTDAAINPGNSGGAMFNMKGELVGINSAKIGGTTVEGMGYAIPISEIFGNVENMMNQEARTQVDEANRGYLGISIVDVTSEISKTYGLPVGIYISAVESGSGAEAAGLEQEQIITAVNGKSVATSAELKEYLSYYAKGEVVTVTVATRGENGYTYKDVDVTLGESKSISSQNSSQTSSQNQSENQSQNDTQNGDQNSNSSGNSLFDYFPFGY